jgi:hypothetical protein
MSVLTSARAKQFLLATNHNAENRIFWKGLTEGILVTNTILNNDNTSLAFRNGWGNLLDCCGLIDSLVYANDVVKYLSRLGWVPEYFILSTSIAQDWSMLTNLQSAERDVRHGSR